MIRIFVYGVYTDSGDIWLAGETSMYCKYTIEMTVRKLRQYLRYANQPYILLWAIDVLIHQFRIIITNER